ncbi:ABC transporter substrate-binding protein [Nitratireductor indicus]|uniref:ABC transporter substrate-binding protein n=1 Tax=Nitratireductor indicus TaxID=721133 RepID=UPI0028753432|nr:ABC transporter substrate-binding protein [Nitratireductor indicus]MDS1134990.1 ABC transporter substrate-binding protein [Nitratireductor indicus]
MGVHSRIRARFTALHGTRAAMLAFGLALTAAPFSLSDALAQTATARIALSGGLDRLDPSMSANGTDLVVMSQIYETLLQIDPATGELKPKLAESYSAKSPTVWEIKLRKDVTFHDGTPLTAADVKYTLERLLDKDLGSPHYSQLTSIKEVRAVDDHTVEIETETPNPVLMRRMQPIGGSGRVFIVSKAYFESHTPEELINQPMGTGPYKLESWQKGNSLTLARNEDYWGEKPAIEKGVFTFIPENSTRVNALLQGEVDVIQRLPISDVERVKQSDNAHVVSSPNGLVHTLLLDSSKPPFDDIDVRKAFAHALDTEDMVDGLLGEYGRVLGVPLGPNAVQFDDTIEPYAYDPDLSEKLLEGKTPIKLDTFTSDGRYVNDRDFYQVINSQLDQVGFEITPQTLEWGRFINMMQNRSGGPFYIIGWDFGEGDASKMNSFLQSSSALSVTQDAEYDRLVAAAGQEPDDAKRTEIWKQVQKYVHDQYFIAAVWQASSLYGFSKKLDWTANFGENLALSEFKLAQQ